MKILQKEKFFKTSDIALCAALSCCGYAIETVDRQNPRKATFLIRKDEKLEDFIQLYFTHQLKVEPLAFFNFLKEIKTRIYHAD